MRPASRLLLLLGAWLALALPACLWPALWLLLGIRLLSQAVGGVL